MPNDINIYDTLIEELVTTDRSYSFINALEIIIQKEYDSTNSTKNLLDNFIPLLPIKEDLSLSLQDIAINKGEKEFFEFLKNIKVYLTNTKVAKITFAITPSLGFLKEVRSNIIELVGSECLFDIEEDPEIVTGLIVSYNGIYHDLSFHMMSNNYFENHTEEVFKIKRQGGE